jgi:hypothetical protein
MIRDINHSIKFHYLKTTRGFRDHAKPHLMDLWNGLVDVTNSTARAGIGLMVVVLSISQNVLKQWQKSWYRKEKRL